MKIKFNKEQVGNTIKTVGSWVLGTAFIVLPHLDSVRAFVDEIRSDGNVTYSDAIGAIMNSYMSSTDKTKAVEALSKDGDTELYKSVIQIVGSYLCSSDKVNAIKHICNKEEES